MSTYEGRSGPALTAALTAHAPTDQELDRAAWRHGPPVVSVVQSRQMLEFGSREAIHRFTGGQIERRSSRAMAFLARFPERVSGRGLHINPKDLLNESAWTVPVEPFVNAQSELELGM